MKWLWGIDGAAPDSDDIWLYHRAQLCRMFPAYSLESIKDADAAEVLKAAELLGLAAKAQSQG